MEINSCQFDKTIPMNSSHMINRYQQIDRQNLLSDEIYSNFTSSAKKTSSSGSETDVSTSTENLSPEDHFVLRNGTRQEPQGEETFFKNNCLSWSNFAPVLENLDDDKRLSFIRSDSNKQIFVNLKDDKSNCNSTKGTNCNQKASIISENDTIDPIYSYITPLFMRRNMLSENLINNEAQIVNAGIATDIKVRNRENYFDSDLFNQQESKVLQLSSAINLVQNTSNNENNSNEICQKNDLISLTLDNDSPYSNLNLLKFNSNSQQKSSSTAHSAAKSSQPQIPTIPPSSNLSSMPLNANKNQVKFGQKKNSVIKFQSIINHKSSNSMDYFSKNGQTLINLQKPMLDEYLESIRKDNSAVLEQLNLPLHSMSIIPVSTSLSPKSCEQSRIESWSASNNFMNLDQNNKSLEKFSTLSRSHPDLSKLNDIEIISSENHPFHHQISQIPLNSDDIQLRDGNLFEMNPKQSNAVQLLLMENSHLRAELNFCYKKIEKFDKVDSDIQKIYQSYDELVKSSEKKEKFEREARLKLEIEIKKLQKQNKYLQESGKSDTHDADFEKELNKRTTLISYLLTKNKELINLKERQEIELEAQRLTLQEQRNHIEILDTALINAQNNIMTLENELRSQRDWKEKTLFLEKALTNLQSTYERRLQMEKRLRTYLEKELARFKNKTSTEKFETVSPESISSNLNNIEFLKSKISDYEKKIIELEADCSKWEQKYLEENTLRSIEVSVASAPKDAKIAALEQATHESEKLIAEARSEHLKHMDEIHIANRKCAELESKLKDLNFRLAEKDTIIKVLQKHSDDRDATLQKTLKMTNARHCKSASSMGLVVSNNGPQVFNKDYSLMFARTSNSATLIKNKETPNLSSTLDEQLKEIENSQSANKDSIINALRSEKERYPNHYNNWRL
ncbi:beta-1 4-galactosyltransferase 7 [Sarcoptes scabiei]|uniref:Angiomotin n=1 Tax=Sarcoptes scabiei TaxID=52283 RepID=A0A834R6I7_SARSC|nr:beta-1 4-galactosyltransferase 7 [Sarcoptes scabiei]